AATPRQGADMRPRPLPLPRPARRAAQAVAAIVHELALDARRRDVAVRHADVEARDGVRAELRRQARLGPLGLGEHEQPRRVLVDAVHHVERHARRRLALPPPGVAHEIHRGAGLLLVVRDRRHPGGLVDHHEVRVLEDDAPAPAPAGGRPRPAPPPPAPPPARPRPAPPPRPPPPTPSPAPTQRLPPPPGRRVCPPTNAASAPPAPTVHTGRPETRARARARR